MDEELIYCKECNANYLIQWEHDDDADNFLQPNYCPLCGAHATCSEDDLDYEYDDYQ